MTARSRHGNATLEELERSNWGVPERATHLVTECHRLRRVQLRLFTPENLRLLIGQQIGLNYLIPMALELLSTNPLTEGDNYPGDLLGAVLRANPSYWDSHPEQREEVQTLVPIAQSAAESEGKVVRKALVESLAVFRKGDHGSN